ncbi:SdrD B-like domain-containing protein [Taibaiella koreensis]|uniref:SdrD B-like domain-containing protein n=1 Tax=Taibaiella koreensis TaxID=1268548 RepID=UPI000E59C0AE|nr:SdrD B-like domain-containing protein [Taibaiella koreensis]
MRSFLPLAGLLLLPAFAQAATLSGSVRNDNDGMINGVDGAPLTGITVNLLNAAGNTQISSTVTDASGSYSFTVSDNNSYVVSIVPPSGFFSVSATDATPTDTRTQVAVAGTDVTNIDFGLNQPPTAYNDYFNIAPGSSFTIPNILANDIDPNGGTLSPDSVTLIYPLSTDITNIIFDAQNDAIGYTKENVGSWLLNTSTGELTFTPVPGYTGVPGTIYSVTDKAGLTSNWAGPNINYVRGSVYDDNDAGVPDGTGLSGTTVRLYTPDGATLISATLTDAAGHYQFPTLTPGDYLIKVVLPAGYQNVGATDATPTDGSAAVTIGDMGASGIDFGINRPPTANTTTAPTVDPPTTDSYMPVDATGFGGTDPNNGNIDSIRITGFPTNTNRFTVGNTTYYPSLANLPAGCSDCAVFPAEGIAVATNTAGQPAAALSVDPSGNTATTVVIPYVTIDNAHLTSDAPGSLTLPFGTPLPLTWHYFSAEASGNDVLLHWATVTERNTDRFEVEYAVDGSHFSKLGSIKAAGDSYKETTYSLKHEHASALGAQELHYRIKQIDRDGRYTYSEVRIATLKAGAAAARLYPNPIASGGSITLTSDAIQNIEIYSSTGRLVFKGQYKGEKHVQILTGQWSSGMYQAHINGSQILKFVVR